jgi:hypothetical protein
LVALSPPTVLAPPRRTRPASRHRDNRALELIEGSLSVRRIERSAPWLASLHRLSDGTLVGIGFCMLALSALTLHWQARWSQSYTRLEATQVLEHRLQEASALLEQHHLAAVKRPGWLVPTRSEKLIYLPPPPAATPLREAGLLLNRMQSQQIPAGY